MDLDVLESRTQGVHLGHMIYIDGGERVVARRSSTKELPHEYVAFMNRYRSDAQFILIRHAATLFVFEKATCLFYNLQPLSNHERNEFLRNWCW